MYRTIFQLKGWKLVDVVTVATIFSSSDPGIINCSKVCNTTEDRISVSVKYIGILKKGTTTDE